MLEMLASRFAEGPAWRRRAVVVRATDAWGHSLAVGAVISPASTARTTYCASPLLWALCKAGCHVSGTFHRIFKCLQQTEAQTLTRLLTASKIIP